MGDSDSNIYGRNEKRRVQVNDELV